MPPFVTSCLFCLFVLFDCLFAHLSLKSFADSKKSFILKILFLYHWNERMEQLLGQIQEWMKSISWSKMRQNETRILASPLPSQADGSLAHWYTCTHSCLPQLAHNGCLDTEIHLADVYLHHLQEPQWVTLTESQAKKIQCLPPSGPILSPQQHTTPLRSKINLVARSHGNSSQREKLKILS